MYLERKTGSGWSKQWRKSKMQSPIHLNELASARVLEYSPKNPDTNARKNTVWWGPQTKHPKQQKFVRGGKKKKKKLKIWQIHNLKWAKFRRFVEFYFCQTLLLLVLTAPGLSCKRITQKSLSNQLSTGGKMKMRKCCPKSCSSSKKWKCSKLERSHCNPILMLLCMPGISNSTESQLDCLWFCSKSGQDRNHSYESLKVS